MPTSGKDGTVKMGTWVSCEEERKGVGRCGRNERGGEEGGRVGGTNEDNVGVIKYSYIFGPDQLAYPSLFNKVCEHNYTTGVLFPHHLPEVISG